MNIIAIDIGNTNIDVGLFLNGEEQFIDTIAGVSEDDLTACIRKAWEQIPVLETSKEGRRDGVIVASSVQPDWVEMVRRIAKDELDEKILVFGKDVPLPITCWVDEPEKVGTDRVIAAAAAYAVVQDAVVVADFGTAVTIDLVDENGVFQGGVILPGFEISAKALKEYTARLPNIEVTKPAAPFGKNTVDAINCGLYYSVVGALEEIIRRYAEEIGKWPQTVITGSAAGVIKDDCQFIDTYVTHLVVRGIVLAYKRHIQEKAEAV